MQRTSNLALAVSPIISEAGALETVAHESQSVRPNPFKKAPLLSPNTASDNQGSLRSDKFIKLFCETIGMQALDIKTIEHLLPYDISTDTLSFVNNIIESNQPMPEIN